jgi:type IV pilus assembly protein PilA
MNRAWIAAPLCFACAAMAGSEQQAVSAAIAELDRAKSSLMQEYAARGKVFPKTSEWEYRSNSGGSVAYNSRDVRSAALVALITETKNEALYNRHVAYFAQTQPDGTLVWTCGTARSALRTSPSEETSMYPYLPPECQH